MDHPRIAGWVSDFVRRVNFTGQIGFDFIEDRNGGGDLFCIECNPRATSGIMMFTPEDGVDRAFLGTWDPADVPITPGSGVDKMIGLGMLLYGWRPSSRKDRTLRDFVRDFRGASDVVSSPGDQKPALMLPFAYAGILRSCLKYRVGLAEGFMHDHEWDGLRISL